MLCRSLSNNRQDNQETAADLTQHQHSCETQQMQTEMMNELEKLRQQISALQEK